MTLTTNGKNYIAQKFGLSNCYTATGLSWTAVANDGNQVNETGGTASIIGRLVTTSIYASVIINSVTYTYAQLKTANDNTDLTLADAQWIAANDGTPTGEAQYCYTVTTGSISFSSSPTGASIYLDGTLQTLTTNATITNVSAGSHSYTLSLSGYNSATGTITVTAGQTATVSVTLTPSTGSISFSSSPSGADIYIDGTLQSVKTPSTISNVSPGSHSYTIHLSGYTDATGTTTVTAGQTATVSVTLVPIVTTGSISFSSTPYGANIYLDGTLVGITPATISNVTAGSHSYTLTLSGYNNATGTVTVTAGQTFTVSVTLTAIVTTGSISFTSSPSGASIYLDGTLQTPTTPATITNISSGSHTYKLTLNGYDDSTGTVTVTAGQTSTVSVTLTAIVTTGSISFASTPSGASITLDSVNLGQVTPYTKSGISAGNHSYLLKLSGYKDYLGTVTVTADQTVTVTAQLILDVAMDKITLNDSFSNYTCYGFTTPKDEFSCNTETFKVHAIYSNGYCDVPPTVNQFIWYKWDTVELRFIEYIRTSIFSIGTGYCTTEANLPCNNMYKVTYQTTEKILTIEQQTIQEFGMGMVSVALVGLFILSKMVSKK